MCVILLLFYCRVMKKMIEDPSTLVAKRKRVPHTDYPEKRIKRFTDPSRSSWDPLIPCK